MNARMHHTIGPLAFNRRQLWRAQLFLLFALKGGIKARKLYSTVGQWQPNQSMTEAKKKEFARAK